MKRRTLTWSVGAVVALACALMVQTGAAQGLPDSFTSLQMNYCDPDGPGTLTIAKLDDDAASGGSAISASLTQGGNSFSGVGIVRQVQPQVYLIAFAFSSPEGDLGFFDGLLTSGIDSWSAQGMYRLAATQDQSAPWRANANFPPLPVSCS